MRWNTSLLSILACALLGVAFFVVPADAQSIFDPPSRPSSSSGFGGGLRLAFVVVSTVIGFALGRLLTERAREVRLIALFIIGMVVLVAVLTLEGPLGWSVTFLVSVTGFALALGYWARVGLSALAEVPTTFGSSHWATTKDLEDNGLLGDEGISLGETLPDEENENDFISYKGDRHLLTVAPTRSGKGTTQIIPNLLTYEGSMLVIDPKGENALITAKQRKKMGQEVHIADPWGIAADAGLAAAQFNPLDWLVSSDLDITENAMLLADALIIGDNHKDQFWTEEAKALIQGVILFVATDPEEEGVRHLGRVRDLLLQNGETMKRLFAHMTQSPHHVVRSTGERCLQKEEKLMSNVLATAQAQTHFLDSGKLRENLSRSDFTFETIKTTPTTVYLVLPADRLHTFNRWLRLIVQQALTINARNIAAKPEKPVLFLLDELPSLGRLTMIEQAYSLMAGFGLQLWGIVQDCSQLKSLYGDGWETFVGNSGVVQYFGSRDRMTAEYFSALCGETTVWSLSTALSKTFSSSSGAQGGSSSDSLGNTDTRAASQRKLAYPDELMRLASDSQLLFVENMAPIIARREPWYEDQELKELGVNLHANATKPVPSNAMQIDADTGNAATVPAE